MLVYATSGSLLIFRTTDFLKYEQTVERFIEPGLQGKELGSELRLKGFEIREEDEQTVIFEQGAYDKTSGHVVMRIADYPLAISKMVKLHKATTDSPLYFLNLFFGVSLLFFAISAFFMFVWKMRTFKTGLKFAACGFLLTIAIVAMG
jgi:hypothetical protein